MSLISAFMTPCVFIEKERVPDGAGGFYTTYKEGQRFDACITLDTTITARIAEKQKSASVYTITTNFNTSLLFHDIVKRLSDGQYFRVTSDGIDKRTPSLATFQISQVEAERWELQS